MFFDEKEAPFAKELPLDVAKPGVAGEMPATGVAPPSRFPGLVNAMLAGRWLYEINGKQLQA